MNETKKNLVAINGNYIRFSKGFDKQMKNVLNKTKYQNMIPTIKAEIFMSIERKSPYTIVIYKAEFYQESDDDITA